MSGIIPKEQAQSARPWSLPAVSADTPGSPDGPPATARSADPRAQGQPPTAAQFEAVYAEAEAQGRAEGHAQGLAAGHAEGYARGLEEGRQTGLAQGRAAAQADAQALAELLRRVSNAADRLDAELEKAVLALALEVARQVVLHEVRTQPEQLLPLLRQALAAFPAQAGVPWIRLHPDDLALVSELAPDLAERGVELIPDTTLQRGDALIAADPAASARPERRWRGRGREAATELDLRLEERWRQVMGKLFEEGLQ